MFSSGNWFKEWVLLGNHWSYPHGLHHTLAPGWVIDSSFMAFWSDRVTMFWAPGLARMPSPSQLATLFLGRSPSSGIVFHFTSQALRCDISRKFRKRLSSWLFPKKQLGSLASVHFGTYFSQFLWSPSHLHVVDVSPKWLVYRSWLGDIGLSSSQSLPCLRAETQGRSYDRVGQVSVEELFTATSSFLVSNL